MKGGCFRGLDVQDMFNHFLKIKPNNSAVSHHTENSCKFTIPKIKEMLSTTGFQIRDVWYDEKQHYCLVLFSKND